MVQPIGGVADVRIAAIMTYPDLRLHRSETAQQLHPAHSHMMPPVLPSGMSREAMSRTRLRVRILQMDWIKKKERACLRLVGLW